MIFEILWAASIVTGAVAGVIKNQESQKQANTQAEIDKLTAKQARKEAIGQAAMELINKQKADLEKQLTAQKKQDTSTVLIIISAVCFCMIVVKWALKK